ncbi:hypothetical protein V1505DRAFT_366726 [Lipomyces doorenjongii]
MRLREECWRVRGPWAISPWLISERGSHHAAKTGSALRMCAKMPFVSLVCLPSAVFYLAPALSRVATAVIAAHLLKSRHDTINIIVISFACCFFYSCAIQ